jgi:outer membrane lipopolysaccharide assembly protein LptE/RlpB
MKITQILDIKLLLTLVFIANSCGYELRNYSTSLSNQVINYDAKKSELNLELENQLNSKNYVLSRNADSDSRLKIISHSIEQFVGSTGQGARTTQVRLDYKLKYQIGNDGGNLIMHIFEDSSFIDFNQSNLLAFEEEIQSVTKTFIAKAIRNIEFIASTQLNEIK